ncbi:hypothetical protein VB773_19655 [Haloarculaceae archaeon H-GB2-1]|nr:hypothetical protein [Haloarculaceae archaeon H-GB1-1]MEA5409574.1 hypothetical protein [Haloarculaceae archaeon H-GB2-1]
MNEQNPAKRIPKSLGTDAKLIGSYSLTDAALALFPGVVVILLGQTFVPASLRLGGYRLQSLVMPAAVVAIVFGAVFVYLAPSYATSFEWVETILGFYTADREVPHQQATEFTQLERVYPRRDALERTDGSLVGLVQVVPPSMALATEDEWAEKAAAFEDFLNTSVTFPIQLYSTTHPFPVETYLDRYESRLTDPDVKANPQLKTLIERYLEWYREDVEARQMTIRDHYVVVSVAPQEVQFDQASLARKLAHLPVVGVFVRAVRAPQQAEQRRAMLTELDTRVRRIEQGLRDIDGCDATRVDVAEATEVLAEFWAGQELEYGDIEATLRTRPLVGEGASR